LLAALSVSESWRESLQRKWVNIFIGQKSHTSKVLTPIITELTKKRTKTTMPDIVKYVIGGVAGAVIGGAIGYFGKCSGST
jgi:hypothetical protein